LVTTAAPFRDTSAHSPLHIAIAPGVGLAIRWGTRESLDAFEDQPKNSRRQVALGQLEDEVPGMPDQTTADLDAEDAVPGIARRATRGLRGDAAPM
jgi:hypothetical protein